MTMKLPPSSRLFVSLRAFALAALACAYVAVPAAAADGSPVRSKSHGALTVGVAQVAPVYKAGAKFRTPESIDHALAEDVARRLQRPLAMHNADQPQRDKLLAGGSADLLLLALADNDPLYRHATVIPIGYSSGPMAIMRSDTTIKSWAQLKGRIVCVAEGSPYAGTLAEKYGAIEQRYKAPADSLLALRTGACDAAVHDSALLEELIKLPEWKKFSARLPTGPHTSLALVAARGDVETARFLKQVAVDWRSSKYPSQLIVKSVRNIAFEVYLDQNVPDCH